MGRSGWYYGGHPPACTCVSCNEGDRRSRSAATTTSDGSSGRLPRTTADYEEEGDGGGMWKWIFVAIIAFVVISAIGGVMEDDDASSKPAPIATSTSVPQRNKAADSDAAFFKSIQDLARESGLTQPEVSIPELESLTHQLINSERAEQGLHTLQFDGSIASIARNHSVDMARRGFFRISTPRVKTPRTEAKA